MEKRLNQPDVVLRAVDLVIADVEERDDSSDRDEALTLLHGLRQKLLDEIA